MILSPKIGIIFELVYSEQTLRVACQQVVRKFRSLLCAKPRLFSTFAVYPKSWIMYISNIKLKNWRNFKEIDVDLQTRVFIIGPNASGKSNLLDVFRFLRDIVRLGGGLQEAVKLRGGVSKIRCLAARAKSDIEIAVDIADDLGKPVWRYAIGFTQTVAGVMDFRAKLKYERVVDLVKDKILVNRPEKKDEKDEKLLEYTNLEQPSSNQEFRDIADFLEGIQYLHILPQLVRDPKSFVNTTTDREDYFGRDFLERVNKTNANTRNAYLRKIGSALKAALPELEHLEFKKDDMGVPHLEAVFKHWRHKGARQQESQFSDGTLRFIGLFWALQDGNKPILLEEPELSLHTAIVTRLSEVIYKLQKKKVGRRQVILTTHSYELLSNKGIDGEEVLVLIPDREGTSVKSAMFRPDINTLLSAGLSVADAAMTRTAPRNVDQLIFDF